MRTPTQLITVAALTALFLAGCGDSKTQESAAPSAETATPSADVIGSPETTTDAESAPAPADTVENN